MVVPEYDEVCLPAHSVLIFDELGTDKKTIRYIRARGGLSANHIYFERVTGDRFVKAMIESIEKSSEEDIQALGPLEVVKEWVATKF